MKGYQDIISQYIHAKDENRPHLMAKAFTTEARLEMQLNTENISFPSHAGGLEAITDILVSKFAQQYENVYTFCVNDSLVSEEDEASCDWLVSMTEKERGKVRVGCGRYDWHFVRQPAVLADSLCITIDEMLVLEARFAGPILDWVSELSYPWCDKDEIINSMPELPVLSSIRKRL